MNKKIGGVLRMIEKRKKIGKRVNEDNEEEIGNEVVK
jgi:hypothetical protein